MSKKERVLFLCSANSCRSQIAEALLRTMSKGSIEVYSCGLDIKPLDPMAVEVMDEIGIDISSQRSKDITEYLGKMHFDYIIVVCDKAIESCPHIWPGGGERLYWPFKDPSAFRGTAEEKLDAYRAVREEIRKKLSSWLGSNHQGQKVSA